MYGLVALMLALLAQQECKAAQAHAAEDVVNVPLARSDYERALTTADRYGQLTVNVPDVPFWLGEREAFVYRRTTHGEHQFILVDAEKGVKQPAFDQAGLAAALNRASHQNYQPEDLPFDHFELTDKGGRMSFDLESTRWSCELASYTCTGNAMHSGANEQSPMTTRRRQTTIRTRQAHHLTANGWPAFETTISSCAAKTVCKTSR
ncbi:hypothetical protein CI1B_22430 [Bradyrhizobium ivorense]|uniref:Uncharacterized protein n=1 Tax=Bradyrhizobium ivorense TaxID=2511166 RepID=A0A508T2E6_9BRAD|nr:hypothetical protein [Bradyrhizobium ivorense]VIO68620.1 hypothetical protein CI1B_22430 [Bradyrhizobium ivorense]VIO69248.1 hypothetical protein CI41S_18360 [Bradyrhizobium ivorense]